MLRQNKSKDADFEDPEVIMEESQFEEGSSNWLKNDLCSLIQSPLEVQLRAILGTNDAISFLRPTIKDKKRATLATSGINLSRKHGTNLIILV